MSKSKIPIKQFDRKHVYVNRGLLVHLARTGNLKLLTLYLKLKRQHRSGHFHTLSKKPNWYPGTTQTFRNHIKKMASMGWVSINTNKSGFSLVSHANLYQLYSFSIEKIQDKYYSKKASRYENKSYQELLSDLQLAVVTVNYQQQIHNICTKEVARTNISSDKIEKKALNLIKKNIYNNVAQVAHLHRMNKTNLSSKGMGKLFGGSSYIGQKVFKDLIDKKHIIRNIETKFVSYDINYSKNDFATLKGNYSCFIKDKKLFRKNTSIILTKFLPNAEEYVCQSSFVSKNIIKEYRLLRVEQDKRLTELKTIKIEAERLVAIDELRELNKEVRKANKLKKSLNTSSCIKPTPVSFKESKLFKSSVYYSPNSINNSITPPYIIY